MDALKCNRCGSGRETTDNFCRRCGHQFTVNLPAVAERRLPARAARPVIPRSVVGSVAVLALGTGLEWLARRMASSAARAAGRALVTTHKEPVEKAPAPPPTSETVTVDEVLYVRRVQLRR